MRVEDMVQIWSGAWGNADGLRVVSDSRKREVEAKVILALLSVQEPPEQSGNDETVRLPPASYQEVAVPRRGLEQAFLSPRLRVGRRPAEGRVSGSRRSSSSYPGRYCELQRENRAS